MGIGVTLICPFLSKDKCVLYGKLKRFYIYEKHPKCKEK